MGEVLDVAQEVKQADRARGVMFGIDPTKDAKVSSLKLVVEFYIDATGEVLGNGFVELSDGAFLTAMKTVYYAQKEKAIPTVYDPAYQAAYGAAYADAIADGKPEGEAVSAGEGAGRNAGNEALINAGIVLPDASQKWTQTQTKLSQLITDVDAGMLEAAAMEPLEYIAAELVSLLKNAGTDVIPWGRYMLREAFRKQVMKVSE